MLKKMFLVISTLLLCSTVNASVENSIRVSKLSSELIARIQKGEANNLVVEFKEGDRLPVNLKAEGDLFESVDSNPTFVEVKKDFYVKVDSSNLFMSLDGVNYKPFNQMVRGSVSVGTNADGSNGAGFPAGAINFIFSAFLR